MVAPVSRKVSNGEFLGRQLNFYTVRSTVNFLPGAQGDASQEVLNKMVEVIAGRGQPIILSVEPVATESAPADLPALTGTGSVYTLKFAIEHHLAWEGANPGLKASLIAAGVGFAEDNLSVTFHDAM